MRNEHEVKYFLDGKGTIRREIPKIRMSKKERIRRRCRLLNEQRFNK